MHYAILEIAGRQYMVKPGQVIEIDKLSLRSDDLKLPGEEKILLVDKVLLMVDKDKVEVGSPYLKQTLNFEVLGNIKKTKIRVATYKAKANYRKVKGQRREITQIKLVAKATEEKEAKKAVKNKS